MLWPSCGSGPRSKFQTFWVLKTFKTSMDQPMCCVFNARDSKKIPCRELTYPSWGKGTSSSKVPFMGGYMRWYIPLTDCFPTLQTSTEYKGSRTWRWWSHRCHIEGEKLMNRMQPETAWKQPELCEEVVFFSAVSSAERFVYFSCSQLSGALPQFPPYFPFKKIVCPKTNRETKRLKKGFCAGVDVFFFAFRW